MNQNADKTERFMKWLKEKPSDKKNSVTNTVMQTVNTTTKTRSVDSAQEELRNVSTTTEQQPPNKFSSNTKKVSGKPLLPGVTTHIARISYGRSDSKKRNTENALTKDFKTKSLTQRKEQKESKLNLDLNAMESSRSSQLIEDFAKKKQEREQEIIEIQEMLNKIKSPQKSSARSLQNSPKGTEDMILHTNVKMPEEVKVVNNKDVAKISPYNRSRTELELHTNATVTAESINTRRSRKDTARSCSAVVTNKSRSKSSQLPLSAKEKQINKKISYNPEEARRYMEMQKKQRKVNLFNDPTIKSKIEKEEIKKRLEELKKNTRKLVSKNIQKKEKIVIKNYSSKESDENVLATPKPQKMQEVVATKSSNELGNELKGLKLQVSLPIRSSKTERSKVETRLQETCHGSSQSLNNILKSSTFTLLENKKRIGLLRKPEKDKDFSFTSLRNFNFDKENQNLEMLTKQLNNPKNKKINDTNLTQLKDLQSEEQQLEKVKEDKETQANTKDIAKDEGISDSEVPPKHLNTNTTEENIKEENLNHAVSHKEEPKSHELPYWLRPSAAQVYPYNFIMAVRRKLEAIAQPIGSRKQEVKKQNQETSTTGLSCKLKQKKRKSLELFEEKQSKKLKRKEEEPTDSKENIIERSLKELNVIKGSTIKSLKPLPQTKLFREYESKENETENKLDIVSEDPAKSISQFKYLQKSIQTVDFQDVKLFNKCKSYWQTSDIPPFKHLQKSLQSLSSDQEDFKQNSHQSKLPSNYKSMESLNSEINSNLSSISLQLPISNTLTEVSSLRTESRRNFTHSLKQPQTQSEDEVTTSLSSQIFSSPEKKLIKDQKDFEFVKPRPVSPLSMEKVDKLKIKRKEPIEEAERDDREAHFTQLLEDFNRSLSQVIQVNEQLKCTLDTQQILSPQTSKKSSETDKNYSSDFEKSTTKMQTSRESDKLKDSLDKSNENLKQRKRQLFEIAEKVKPLLTTQISAKNSETYVTDEKEQPLQELNLNINIKSITNSPETMEEYKTQQTEVNDEEQSTPSIAEQSYEKRLYEIEQLKQTLKQTILKSKEKRKEKERHPEQHKEVQNEKQSVTDSLRQTEETDTNKIISHITTRNGNDSSATLSETETQCEKNKNEQKPSLSHTKTSKHFYEKYKSFEKYQKQHKSLPKKTNSENLKTSDSENCSLSHNNQLQNLQENSHGNITTLYCKNSQLITSSNEMLPLKSTSVQNSLKSQNLRQSELPLAKSKEMSDYSTFNSTNSLNNISSHRHTKSVSNNSSENNHEHFSNKMNAGETDTYSGTQSEIGSTAQTTEATKTKQSPQKTNKPDAAVSLSIAEELQNTYESGLHDNENVPLNSRDKIDSTQFIKSHINRSRGDFVENVSKENLFNETQFQQAIKAASQMSSSGFAQSADDEITSSVDSNPYHKAASNPFSYNKGAVSKHSLMHSSPSKANQGISLGKIFTQYDCERTGRRAAAAPDSMSESSLNYSNVGLYDKLIQNETNKSQHLTALLKMREKALLDRTKGQIAWLEVLKARYKAKGFMNHIAAIKKKQRGIIMKMEKEREEIKRLLYTTTTNSKATATVNALATGGHKTNSQHNTPTKHKKERLPSSAPPLTKPKSLGSQTIKTENALSASRILRATYELESSQALEELLKKREDDLRKRREHVERLMQWLQRLDEEEAEVLKLERQLLSYNNVPHMVEQQQPKLQTTTSSATTEKLTPTQPATSPTVHDQAVSSPTKTPEKKRASRARKMEKRLKEIDKSLRELSHISASSTTSGVMGQTHNENEDTVSSVSTQDVDFVRTTGIKLNKLWKRLTSQQIEKFEPSRRYKLCKSDLERLYEEAKMAVLRDFAEDEERIAQELLEKSASNLSTSASPTAPVQLPGSDEISRAIEVPVLNLNFSSGHSEPEEESANNSQANATQQGNYSPSVAEQNFQAQVLLNSSSSSETISEQQTPEDEKTSSRLKNNVQMFLALSQRIRTSSCSRYVASGGGLQRSLSDTEISEVPKFKADKTTTSQKNIANIASQSNSSVTTNDSARSFGASAQHQRSKSSTVEITYIPSTQTETQTDHTDLRQTTPTAHTGNHRDVKQNDTSKDLEVVSELSNNHLLNRTSVICSVGIVTSTKSSQQTSSDIPTITEDSKSSTALGTTKSMVSSFPSKTSLSPKQTSTFSAQYGSDSATKVKEISSKLEEISAAVTQLSQMNALPSYESVTHAHSKNKSIDEAIENTNDESNLSTDASSYSFNFENITTDKHSSPGTSTLHTNSLLHKTITSKTYTKEDDETKETSSTTPLYSHSGALTSLNSTKSKTFVKGDANISSSRPTTLSMLENRILDTYEADFEMDLSNVTHIEDITIPTFETTTDTIEDDLAEESLKSTSKENDICVDHMENISAEASDKTYNTEELTAASSSSSTSVKSLKPSPDRELLPPPPPPPPLPPPPPPPSSAVTFAASSATTSTQNGSNNLMPDIINELELRRHQLVLDSEHLKQYEHVTAVPYMYVREIPNKPPPPYVPPAHGSPMTTIFPSEDRIKDITFRRTHELYCELLKTEYSNENGEKLSSVMEEQITNIYERIILDICREYLEERSEILRDGDPTNFHSQLAFFNPPNRLRCIQNAIYKEVRSCLAMDKIQPKRTQIYSVYGQRAKQDHIGKIIIQEMYDEDDRWCNFHREESEVLHLMVEEMINKTIVAIAKEVLLEEGGTIDAEEEQEESIEEENEANYQVEALSQIEESEHEGRTEDHTELQSSSVLVETINDDDQTYCVNETKQEYTVLNQNTRIETDSQESVIANNATSNAVQTCT